MKKWGILGISLLLAALLCACGSAEKKKEPSPGGGSAATSQTASQTEENGGHGSDVASVAGSGEADIFSYRAPAEVVKIDTSAEDPSGENIRFAYDDDGRVSGCYYQIGGNMISVTYGYKEGKVQIYAFLGDILVADEVIELPGEYDASAGFAQAKGYYFKGYKF